MLLGIDPLLRGPLLAILDQMGHGDGLAVTDANFPAQRVGVRVVEMPGVSAPAAVRAIVSVFPVDADERIMMMAAGSGRVEVQNELIAAADPLGRSEITDVDRLTFYESARDAMVVVRTGEGRAYGNVILRKGVV